MGTFLADVKMELADLSESALFHSNYALPNCFPSTYAGLNGVTEVCDLCTARTMVDSESRD